MASEFLRPIHESYDKVFSARQGLRRLKGLSTPEEKKEEEEAPGYLEHLNGTIGVYYEPDDRDWHRITIKRSSLRNTLVAGQKGSGKDAADLTLRFVEKRDLGIPQHVVGEDTGEHLCSSLPNTEPWFFENISYTNKNREYLFVDRDGERQGPEGDRIRYVVPYSEGFLESDLYNSFKELFEVVTIPVSTFFELRDAFYQMLAINGTMEQRLVQKSLRILEGKDAETFNEFKELQQQFLDGMLKEPPTNYKEFVDPDPGLGKLRRLYDSLMKDPYMKGYTSAGSTGLSKIERYEDLGLFSTARDPSSLTLDRMIEFLRDVDTTYYYSTSWLGYDDSNVRYLFFLYVSKLIARAKLDARYRKKVPELIRWNVPEMHRYAPRSLSGEAGTLQETTRALLVNAFKEYRKFGLLPSGNDQRIDRLSNEILSEVSEIVLRDIMPSRKILTPIMEGLRMREDDYGQRDAFIASVTMKIDEFIYGFVDPTDPASGYRREGWMAPRYWRKGWIMPPPCMKAPPNFDFQRLYDEYKQRYDNYPCGIS